MTGMEYPGPLIPAITNAFISTAKCVAGKIEISYEIRDSLCSRLYFCDPIALETNLLYISELLPQMGFNQTEASVNLWIIEYV